MFHVRPWGMNLDYDYPKRKQILKEASALLELAPNVYDIITRTYTETIGHLVNREESPLLDEPTRKKVIAKFKQLRRGSIISDFEN